MPRNAVRCDKKAVLVSVYVEKPPRRSSPGRRLRHYDHLRIGERQKGYDRKAELLLYSRHLREAARSRSLAAAPARHDRPATAANNPERIITKTFSVRREQPRSCFGDWKRVLLPSFLKSYLACYNQGKNGDKRRKKKHKSESAPDKANVL